MIITDITTAREMAKLRAWKNRRSMKVFKFTTDAANNRYRIFPASLGGSPALKDCKVGETMKYCGEWSYRANMWWEA